MLYCICNKHNVSAYYKEFCIINSAHVYQKYQIEIELYQKYSKRSNTINTFLLNYSTQKVILNTAGKLFRTETNISVYWKHAVK